MLSFIADPERAEGGLVSVGQPGPLCPSPEDKGQFVEADVVDKELRAVQSS